MHSVAILPLISSDDLRAWTDSPSSYSGLHDLLRRLIRATLGPNAKLHFPSGSQVNVSGSDGIIECVDEVGLVPGGQSIWEVSTEARVINKANRDFGKYDPTTTKLKLKDITFVGVTLRTFGGKVDWCNEKKKLGIWKDVKYYDNTDLSEWLEQYPHIAYTIAQVLGKPHGGIEPIQKWWENLQSRIPHLVNPEWLLHGREASSDQILEHFTKGFREFGISSSSFMESILILLATLNKLEENQREYLLASMLIVSDTPTLHAISKKVPDAIFIPNCNMSSSDFGYLSSCKVIVCNLPNSSKDALKLEPLNSIQMAKHMVEDGHDYSLADRVSKAARSSIQLMAKELGGPSYLFPTPTISTEHMRIVSAICIANRWNSDSEEDTEAILGLAKCDLETLKTNLISLSSNEIPMVRKSGNTWFVTDEMYALSAVATYLDEDQLVAVKKYYLSVLGADDSSFELESDRKYLAGVLGMGPKTSQTLRDGASRSLASLSQTGRIENVTRFSRLSRTVFDELVKNITPRKLYSISYSLPLLAEAVPEEFLSFLENLLEDKTFDLSSAFQIDDYDLMKGASRHPYLMWALEGLAWNPKYLSRVAKLLGLLHLKISKWHSGNSPMNSLKQIFVPWHPSTFATLEERKTALNVLRKEVPVSSWRLLEEIVPNGMSTAMTTHKPLYAPSGRVKVGVSMKEVFECDRYIVAALLEDAETNPERLLEILPSFTGYSDEFFLELYKRLKMALRSCGKPCQFLVWDTLRKLCARHERYPDAEWVMPKKRLLALKALMKICEPSSPLMKYAWLFEQWVDLPEREADFEKRGVKLFKLRRKALQSIYSYGGLASVLKFAKTVSEPYLVGSVFAHLKRFRGDQSFNVFAETIVSRSLWRKNFALGYGAICAQKSGYPLLLDWKERLVALGLGSSALAFCHLIFEPLPEIFDSVEQEGSAVSKHYWRRVNIYRIDLAQSAVLTRVVKKLLLAARTAEVVELLGGMSYHDKDLIGTDIIFESLEHLRNVSSKEEIKWGSLSHYVKQLFELLGARESVDRGRMATLEFFYIPVLSYEYSPIALSGAIRESPSFFLELVSLIYRPDDGVASEIEDSKEGVIQAARAVIESFRNPPGVVGDAVDYLLLSNWVSEIRQMALDRGYARGADYALGDILCKVSAGSDGVWPSEAVCQVLEDCNSDYVDSEFRVSKFNLRGVTTRSLDSGGSQERFLVQKYREYMKVRSKWRRAREILQDLADTYERDAEREDGRRDQTMDLT